MSYKFLSYGKTFDFWCGMDNAPGTMTHEEWERNGLSPEACRQACTVDEKSEARSVAAQVLNYLSLAEIAEEDFNGAVALAEAATAELFEIWNKQWAQDCKAALLILES